MRVLHLTRDFPPHSAGGMSTAVGDLVRASSASGISTSVISLDSASIDSRNGIRTTHIESLLRIGAAPPRRDLLAHLDAFRPDVIHLHHGTLWEILQDLHRVRPLPVVKTVHVVQHVVNELRRHVGKTVSLEGQQRAIDGCDRVIVPSASCAAILTQRYPHLRTRLRVIPHGIADNDEARRNAAARTTRPVRTGLYVGRFDDVKGTADLFSALRVAVRRDRRLHFVIAGGVPANRRAERRWRQQWESESPADVRRRVTFVGWLDRNGVAAAYNAADFLVVPSRFETCGLSALEGMLHGLPIAATSAGGLADLLQDGVNALLSPPGDPAALAENIGVLTTSPSTAHRLGARARATALRRHNWVGILAAHRRVYSECCGPGALFDPTEMNP
jgi:glycosyltransferase involved in cell wall biosynthesis